MIVKRAVTIGSTPVFIVTAHLYVNGVAVATLVVICTKPNNAMRSAMERVIFMAATLRKHSFRLSGFETEGMA